ncbi:hypothetical protein P7D22_00635 [Lichenihabitans sp. Uapishka_5]|uniref:hypothetical protein n=1 Tax=Lichenihabitans sp. Uapishka_5 TaxID=3037302 RepID=UPI0029E809FF|nr:hypothetical protein [Lichenihabitans sp. Uapishka_5]MDX7949682.1 hypothetical protein [Lichenihabitans sp. Uapishka_5]
MAIGIVLAAIAVILAVGVALFRLIFGRRLHMSGGRTRQPRLGVVDAFDLDRQRQLVLIRRDNVEHLLMIGGPNDVLVEAAIVRTPAMLAGREKDAGVSPTVGIPAPVAQQAPVQPVLALQPTAVPALAPMLPNAGLESGPGVPMPMPAEPRPSVVSDPGMAPSSSSRAPEAAPSSQPTPETRLPTAATLPAAARPVQTTPRPGAGLPPRPPVGPVTRPVSTPTPRTNLPRATPNAPAPASGQNGGGRQEPALGRPLDPAPVSAPDRDKNADQPRESSPLGRAPAIRVGRTEDAASPADATRGVGPGPSLPRPTTGEDNAAPVPSVARPLPRPATTPSAPTRAVPPRPTTPSSPPPAAPTQAAPRAPLPSLGSLEEEMAKLLGRPMPPPDPSGSDS